MYAGKKCHLKNGMRNVCGMYAEAFATPLMKNKMPPFGPNWLGGQTTPPRGSPKGPVMARRGAFKVCVGHSETHCLSTRLSTQAPRRNGQHRSRKPLAALAKTGKYHYIIKGFQNFGRPPEGAQSTHACKIEYLTFTH